MRILFIIVIAISFLWADSELNTTREPTAMERILAGVILLEGKVIDSQINQRILYDELLENEGVSHIEFQEWLSDMRDNAEDWHESVEAAEQFLQ